MKRKITAISIMLVCLCMLVLLAACGANGGVKEIVANDKTTIYVQGVAYDGFSITVKVQSVKWTNNGALIVITYEDGSRIVTSAENYVVKVYTK